MVSKVLYVRISNTTHKALKRRSIQSGVPMATIADILLARALGIPHALDKVVPSANTE